MKDLNLAVEKHTKLILDAERYIWQHPETGYKEFETSAYMEKIFRDLGYDLVMADGITGFYTVIDTGKPGPEVLILAELDSVICSEHKDANPLTGAVHACGHNAQCAAMAGIAAALKEPGILDKFSGRIRLCLVPAEELLEIKYRTKLKNEGKIKYFGGKTEFLSRGYFDGVDLAFMVHTSLFFGTSRGSVGCMSKRIIYKGVAAHAGGAPWGGKNALYAANCGINAINAIRETFKEKDIIRVHPIITNGGAIVNAIPDKTVLESYVRGASFEAICEANKNVNRALCGAAISIGTNIEIVDIHGYAPLINDSGMIELTEEAVKLALPEYKFENLDSISSGSTDMGELCQLMPVVHPYSSGQSGFAHGDDFQVADFEKACIKPAKMQLAMIKILLGDGAKRAKKIIEEFDAPFKSKEEYFAYIDSINCDGDRIEYKDGEATVRL